jgi:GTP pyrophosphokinase
MSDTTAKPAIDYNREVVNRYRALLRSLNDRTDAEGKKLIRQAFDLANHAHSGVVRKSGEPYILHPLEVALIASKEIGLGVYSVAVALLHDVVEDTDYTLEDMQERFGPKIAQLIEGLTKISGVFDQNVSIQAENFRKMLLTISDDIRVVLIKLADRLHNMRTMDAMAEHKQRKIASETLFIYAPLAHRLGLYNIKSELEDLSLKYTEPEVYNDIKSKLAAAEEDEIKYLKRFSARLRIPLKREGLKYTIKERAKSIFSIRKKMINQGVPFEEVYDKFAIRIILDSEPQVEKSDCWKAYSVVTDHYRPNPDRLRDWISSPKSNGYESLHTTVMGPGGHWVEVQIRTRRMDEVAEKGYAAHWRYKDDSTRDEKLEQWINQVRQVLEHPSNNALEFLDDFKLNLFSSEIFVFTPKGEIRQLPKGATPLDFAFDIHTNVGSKTLGVKVNGRLVPLNTRLKSGDQVEVITSERQKPKEDWLNIVVTAKAKSAIKQALKEEKRQVAADGKEILLRKLRALKVEYNEKVLHAMAHFFDLSSQDLLYKIGLGVIDNQRIRDYFRENNRSGIYQFIRNKIFRTVPKGVEPEEPPRKESQLTQLVFGPDKQVLDYKMSKCCNPIPGDKVFGLITAADGIKVHRIDCPNAVSLQSKLAHRIITAQWASEQVSKHNAVLSLRGIDTVGLVNKVTQIISKNMSVNIKSLAISGDKGLFEGTIDVEVQDRYHLTQLIEKLKKIEGVTSVERTLK